MDSKSKDRTSVTINWDTSVAKEINETIKVPFDRSIMYVRQIVYKLDETELSVTYIFSTQIGDYIGCFYDACSSNPGTSFNIVGPLTEIKLALHPTTSGKPGAVTRAGKLGIVLEFQKV